MVDAVKKVQLEDEETWKTLAGHILKNISITDAKISEMQEYMTSIDMFAIDNGIRLPLPEDQGMDVRIHKR